MWHGLGPANSQWLSQNPTQFKKAETAGGQEGGELRDRNRVGMEGGTAEGEGKGKERQEIPETNLRPSPFCCVRQFISISAVSEKLCTKVMWAL